MDDSRRRFAAGLGAAALLAFTQTGCALLVMAGKMFFGDPLMPPVFQQRTSVDLTKSGDKVLVICTTPQYVRLELPGVDHDLMDDIARRLRRQGIRVADRDDVIDWLDANGGDWGSPNEIAAHCDADYIVHMDFEHFSFQDPTSPGLMQGKVSGVMQVYEVREEGGVRIASERFAEGFESTYPEHNPVSHDQVSPRAFQQKFMDRLGKKLAQMLHPSFYSEMIE